MKNPRQATFEESKITIYPYITLPTKVIKCMSHNFERREDGFGHIFLQCKTCGITK